MLHWVYGSLDDGCIAAVKMLNTGRAHDDNMRNTTVTLQHLFWSTAVSGLEQGRFPELCTTLGVLLVSAKDEFTLLKFHRTSIHHGAIWTARVGMLSLHIATFTDIHRMYYVLIISCLTLNSPCDLGFLTLFR